MKDGWELYDENNPEHNDPSLYGVMEWSKEYMSDGRRPDFVEVGSIYEDAERRDFTINSLYMNPWTQEVVDPTGNGLKDIENKILRFNGKAKERISEDKLRIMRCYRFSAQLGFEIEKKALKACRTYFEAMTKEVSAMRIMNEVEKMSRLKCLN